MKRNVLVIFVSHIIISLLYYPSMFAIGSLIDNLGRILNPEVEDFGNAGIVTWLVFTIIFTYFLYFLAGRLFLKPIEEKRSNFVSVWSLGIILISLSILNGIYGTIDKVADDTQFLFVYLNPIGDSFRVLLYNLPGNYQDPYYFVLYLFLPLSAFLTSACLWLGLMLKTRRIQERFKKSLSAVGEKKN